MIGPGRFPAPPNGHTPTVDRISRRFAQTAWILGCLCTSVALQIVHNFHGG